LLNVRILLKRLLQDEEDLTEVVQLIGKDSLSEDQKIILDVAQVIKSDFLAQNAFTDYDYMCPLKKTVGMMKCIVTFFDLAMKTLKDSTGDQKRTWAGILAKTKDEFTGLSRMKNVLPKQSDFELDKIFSERKAKIEEKFKSNFS